MALTWAEIEDLMRPEGGLDLTLADLIPPRPAWMALGTCRDRPDVTFFPSLGESTRAAKALCAACPVRGLCGDYAMADPDLDGIWSGTTNLERRALRRAS